MGIFQEDRGGGLDGEDLVKLMYFSFSFSLQYIVFWIACQLHNFFF
jgi:hypothetical protein